MSGTEVEWVVDSVIRLPGSPGVAREGPGSGPNVGDPKHIGSRRNTMTSITTPMEETDPWPSTRPPSPPPKATG